MDFDFTGKQALVTGGSRGIGKAIAELLLRLNCNVIISSTKRAPSWIKQYKRCEHILLDFFQEKSQQSFFKEIKNRSRIDILINNAGIHLPEAIYRIKDDSWDKLFKVNLSGPMRIMREVTPKMIAARKGKILNISSIAGVVSKPGSGIYSASKAALIGLTRAAALDLATYNILVNALCPGHTQTEMLENVLTKKQRQNLKEQIPLKRFATPLEIANFAMFLCSDLNTYITGQTIIVDGGVTIK